MMISAKLLGGVSFKVDGKELLKNKKKLPKHVELLAILLTYHDRQLSPINMSSMLWDDQIEDPVAALKNCVYNLRKVLKVKDNEGKDVDFILTEGGQYRINETLSIDCDLWEFQKLVRVIRTSESEADRIVLCRKLIALYSNEYLNGTSSSFWAVQETEFVRQQYTMAVVELCKILSKSDDEDAAREVLDMCNNVVLIDPLAHEVYYYMYKAMYKLEMHATIRNSYPGLVEFFSNDLAMDIYPEMTEIYEKSCDSHLDEADALGGIMDNLSSATVAAETTCGAYVCNYDTFKHMYQLKFRASDRSDDYVALLLISLFNENGSDTTYEMLSDDMEKLREVVRNTLRKGDVISRFSGNQIIAMATIKKESDTEIVKARLKKTIDQSMSGTIVKIECSCANSPVLS